MDIGPQLGDNKIVARPLTLLSLLLACGPGSAATTGTSASDTATSDTATSDTATSNTATSDTATSDTATSDTADPTQAPTTGTQTTDVATPSTSTTSTTSTTSDTTLADTTSETGGDAIEYAAFFWAGGLDHIFIHRADFTHDRCATLHLARPGGMTPGFVITAPDSWTAVNAAIAEGTEGCLAGMPVGASVEAIAGAGAVAWPPAPNQLCPPLIDLDLGLDFPQELPWVPAQAPMLVTALAVEGCP